MKRRPAMPALIADDIALVEGEREKLLTVFHLQQMTYEARREKLRAAEAAAIGRLTAAGARFSEQGDTTLFRFRGLRASSTMRVLGALGNWAKAARTKIPGGGDHGVL